MSEKQADKKAGKQLRLPENGALKIDPRNVRVHGRENKKRIKQSLQAIGAGRGILADGENIIRAGNGIYEQAKKLGFKFKIVDVDDKTILVSRRPDLKGKKAIRAAMLDNLSSDASAYDYDADIFADVINNDTLLKAIADEDEKLQALLGENDGQKKNDDEHAAELVDKAEELQKKWKVKLGDLWECGEHRVICGDCTQVDVVSKILGDEKLKLMLTDPPYGVKRDKGFEGFGGFGTPIKRRRYTGEWDKDRPTKDVFDFLFQFVDDSMIWGGNFFADILPRSTHWCVWDKHQTMPTFGDCELAWTSFKRKSIKKFDVQYNGLLGKEKERFHATQKPVKLFELCLNEYSNNSETIYDPFIGSGTTLIACENLQRKCRAIELNPAYVAVTLQRWSDLTGKKPKRL